MKVAILASDNMMPGASDAREDAFERDEQMGKLVPALAGLGVQAELRPWRELASFAGEYEAVLPLLCWDYWDHRETFLSLLEEASRVTHIFNSVEMLRWNTDKAYLAELEAKGTPTIPTLTVDKVDQAAIAKAFATFDEDRIVIKPQVGGGAWRQVSLLRGEVMPSLDALPPGEALIQPFLRSVVEEGEVTLLFFGGEFSHALRKLPKAGDYRVQSNFGGHEERLAPTAELIALARAQLAKLDEMPLYARVDLLRGNDGEMKLIEIEMVEPYLYFGLSEGQGEDNLGAQAFAWALVERLKT